MVVFAIDFSLEATTTDDFCMSCHEMRDNISGADAGLLQLAGSKELHGTCADCHLPKPFLPRVRRKLRAGAEIYHHLLGTLATPESFEARRLQMARRVWAEMNHNDSVECRGCHEDLLTARADRSALAIGYHDRADRNGVGCVDCHKGLTHRMPRRTSSGGGAFDPERCFTCHARENVLATPVTTHKKVAGLASLAALAECAKCHVDAEGHAEFPLRGDRVRFDATARAAFLAQEAACIDCHAANAKPGWRLASHGFSDAACVSCHSIHQPGNEPLLESLREPMCADSCHLTLTNDERGGVPDPTLRAAGTCTSCHDPHARSGDERCLSCHPQGPAEFAAETPEAREFHLRGLAEGIHCDQCHKGMLHRISHAQLAIPRRL